MNEEISISKLRIDSKLPENTAEINGWPTDNYYIKCVSTTLIVSKRHFQDVFNKLNKGDTFKAVVSKHVDARLSYFKYFLKIDGENV